MDLSEILPVSLVLSVFSMLIRIRSMHIQVRGVSSGVNIKLYVALFSFPLCFSVLSGSLGLPLLDL